MAKYFISHSANDKEIANSFINFLVTGADLKRRDFFCSSKPGNDIPCGEDFVKYIKEQLGDDTKVTFALFSQNYLNSNFSMIELGVSWAMNIEVVPILLKGVSFDGTTALLRNNSGITINNDDDLNKLGEKIRHLDSCNINLSNWSAEVKQFIGNVSVLLEKQQEPEKVEFKKLKEQKNENELLKKENKYLQKEIERVNDINFQLQHPQNNESPIATIAKNSSVEMFQEECKNFQKVLNHFSKAIVYACFIYLKEGPDAISYKYVKQYQGLDEAIKKNYLIFDGGQVFFNKEAPKIQKLLNAINNFKSYIDNCLTNYDITEYVENNLEVEFSLESSDFWEEVLGIEF